MGGRRAAAARDLRHLVRRVWDRAAARLADPPRPHHPQLAGIAAVAAEERCRFVKSAPHPVPLAVERGEGQGCNALTTFRALFCGRSELSLSAPAGREGRGEGELKDTPAQGMSAEEAFPRDFLVG